jgi:hypothetical protein
MEDKEVKYYEEFSVEGKNIIYIDFSEVKSDEEYSTAFEKIERAIASYPECSLYTITNMAGVRIDTLYKDNFIRYGKHNKPYVKKGVLIGMDGVTKMIVDNIIKKAGRDSFHIAFTKEKAIEWILQQD